MKPIVSITSISKKYRIGLKQPYYSLRDALIRIFTKPFTLFTKKKLDGLQTDEFWAVKDVSFNIYAGESIGIIGRNGAGKSTLLKILSRITPPSSGEVILRGRVASLLEVGTGFNPELTGRENIYLNGAILGMKQWEIKKHFASIVEFAEIEKFLDTPVKRYSSGMYMRLAFAVAAHLTPEILIVDEVLAVGDTAFQKKCIGKMDEVAKSGRTVLFVSHNMGAIRQLCSKVVVLERGKVLFEGPVEKGIAKYLASVEQKKHASLLSIKRIGDYTLDAKIAGVTIESGGKKNPQDIDSRKPMTITVSIETVRPTEAGVCLYIKDENQRTVIYLVSGYLNKKIFHLKKGKSVISCMIPSTNLTSGSYTIDVGLLYPERDWTDFVPDAVSFSVDHMDPFDVGFELSQRLAAYHVHHTWKRIV